MVDYISRALVADALTEWREQLRSASTVSPLRDLAASDSATIEINSAHPSGLAQLFAHRGTLLSTLMRDDAAYRAAAHRAGLILTQAEHVMAATGSWTAALVVGTAAWDGHEVPIILRGLSLERARENDVLITLHHEAWLNPVFGALVREMGDESPLAPLAAASTEGAQFDPRPTWNAVRELTYLFGEDFEVRERLLIGAYDDPEQRLLDDLDELDPVIGASDVIAAAVGDTDAKVILAEPLPRWSSADRDPFGERGLGDLDDVAFAALDVGATGRSLALNAGPGSDPVGFVAAAAADAAASGRTVAVVGGTDDAVAAVAARLDALGAGEIYLTGAMDAWTADARARLLASLTLEPTHVDEDRVRAMGQHLVDARHDLKKRLDALHRPHRPWGVSAFEAVQAVVRLTAGPLEPSPVRLGADAGVIVADHGLAGVAAALVRRLHGEDVHVDTAAIAPATAALEAAAARPTTPWWTDLVDEQEGARLDEALAVLVRHVSSMRTEAAAAAQETGLDPAENLAAWAEQVILFTDVRATLETFSPAVYHRSLVDLIAATAPLGSTKSGQVSRKERRSLVRRATELLRPGRENEQLHERLQAAHDEMQRWRAHCSVGGWPVVPDAFDTYSGRLARVQAAWNVLVSPLTPEEAETLALQPWDALQADLDRMADGIPGGIDHAPARPAEVDLDAPGFAPLLEHLAATKASPEQIRVDLEFAWWGAAFDAIAQEEPELTHYGALGAAVERYLAYDAAFADARLGPLLRAVAERRRSAIARHPDHARDLFAALVEGVGGSVKHLWRDFAPVVTSLRPVVLANAEQVPSMLPPAQCVDTVIVLGAESLALAELIPALARAKQVIVVADLATATRSAVIAVGGVLPALSLHALPQARDPRVTRVLAESVYGRSLPAVPSPGEPEHGSLTVVTLDAIASPAAGSVTVESNRAEVAAVVAHVSRLAASVPRRSVAVVAGNELHAARIADALAERSSKLRDETPVVTVGNAGGVSVDEVVFTLGYARDTRGGLPETLGDLSAAGGAAAMAQATVVGRKGLTVVTSLEPHHLTTIAAASEVGHGVGALRELIMAQERPVAAPERPRPGPSDWLLADVAKILRAEGYAVRLRYGYGPDAIAMVVGGKHDRGYKVAVVTDEAAPGASGSLRDRVRWQYARLEALDWKVVSLWTIDVFMDPQAAAAQVRTAIDALETPEGAGGAAAPRVRVSHEAATQQAVTQETEPEGGAGEPSSAPDFLFGEIVSFEVDGPWEPGPEPDPEPEPWPEADPESDEIEMTAERSREDVIMSEVEPASEVAADDPPEDEDDSEYTVRRSREQELDVPTRPNPKPVVPGPTSRGTERPLIPTRAWEDEDAGWGGGSRSSSREDDIKREKPPHY